MLNKAETTFVARPYKKSIFQYLFAAIVLPSAIGLLGLIAVSFSIQSSARLQEQLLTLSDNLILEEHASGHFVSYCFNLMSSNFEPDKRNQFLAKARLHRIILNRDAAQLKNNELEGIPQLVKAVETLSKSLADEHFNNDVQRFKALATVLKQGVNVSRHREIRLTELEDQGNIRKNQLDELQSARRTTLYLALFFSFAVALIFIALYYRLVSSKLQALSVGGSSAKRSGSDELSYLQQQLNQAYADVTSLQEQKAMLIQMVAHDLRSPLMATTASLDVFEDTAGDFLPPEMFDHTEQAQKDLKSAYELANKFLVLEAIDANKIKLNFESVDLKEVLNEIIFRNEVVAQKQLKFEFDGKNYTAFCDRELSETALSCWIDWVAVQTKAESTIHFKTELDNDYLRLQIDFGPLHIDPKDQRHFFEEARIMGDSNSESQLLERFVFNLSRRITEAQSGSVGIGSQSVDHTILWLTLPVCREVQEHSTAAKKQLDPDESTIPVMSKAASRSQLIVGGVLIALTPLVIQCACFMYLYFSTANLAQLEEQVITQLETTASMEKLLNKAFQANSNAAFYAASGQESLRLKVAKAVEDLKRDGLTATLNSNRAQKALGAFAISQANKLEILLLKNNTADVVVLNRLSQTVSVVNELVDTMEQPLIDANNQLQATVEQEKQTSKTLTNTLMLMAFANLFVGVAAIILLQRKFQYRLSRLIQNAQRLPRFEPMEARMPGNDEIAALDASLHATSNSLKLARLRRNATASIIANALASPLQDAEQRIEKLRTMTGEYPNRKSEALQRAEKSILGAKNNCNRLALLCADLIVFATDSSELVLNRTQVELDELIGGVISDFRSLAESRSITVCANKSGLSMSIDEARVYQVLANLISNSLKFAPPNSQVQIQAKQADAQGERVVRIEIADHGRGIDPQIIATLFNKFQQGSTKENRKGFGLGLTICKMIVESHGGKIGASNGNPGTIFTVELPENALDSLQTVRQ